MDKKKGNRDLVQQVDTIRSGFKSMKTLTLGALALSALVAFGSVAYAIKAVGSASDRVYILDKGDVSTAVVSDASVQRKLEVEDHVIRFHELMFNMAPSSDAITSSLDRALLMSDKSAYNYYTDLAEKGFYKRLVSANISQQFSLDSLKTNTVTYPYRAVLYGKLYLVRESNITAYQLCTQCQLTDVSRSRENPHGLMIERFEVVENERIGTRKRN